MEPDRNIRIEVDTERSSGRSPAGGAAARSRFTTWLVAAATLAALAAGIYFLARDQAPQAPQAREGVDKASAVGRRAGPEAAVALSDSPRGEATQRSAEIIAEDDGRLLWASPTSGPPISLDYVPGGTRLLLHLRLADLTAHPEGEKTRAALGPWGERMVEEIRRLTGADVNEIDALLVSVFSNANDSLGIALRATLAAPWDAEELKRRFNDRLRTAPTGQSYLVVGDTARFLPGDDGEILVVCPLDQLSELIDATAGPPPLPRDLATALSRTDAARTATLSLDPRFLQSSGGKTLGGPAVVLGDGIEWLLGRDAAAVAISVDWRSNFFLELCVNPTVSTPPRRYAARMRARIEQAPAHVDRVVQRLDAQAYGGKLIERLPDMMRTLATFTRSGADADQAVARCFLPAPAGHNLVAAVELLIAQPGRRSPNGGRSPPGDAPQATSSQQRLTQRTSLRLRGESLEQALGMLAADLRIPIEINGRDLQLEGITRNQTLDVDLHDQPAGVILGAILRQGNPDPSAQGLADPRQKLIYVVAETDGGPSTSMRIIVTTRAAAIERGDKLPEVFTERGR